MAYPYASVDQRQSEPKANITEIGLTGGNLVQRPAVSVLRQWTQSWWRETAVERPVIPRRCQRVRSFIPCSSPASVIGTI